MPSLRAAVLASVLVAALCGCSNAPADRTTPGATPVTDATASERVPPPAAAMPAATPAATPAAPTACTEPRPEACTMQYDPVCATRDTGIRCVTTPCPSSERRSFSNGCSACSDPKVSDWTKGACPAK